MSRVCIPLTTINRFLQLIATALLHSFSIHLVLSIIFYRIKEKECILRVINSFHCLYYNKVFLGKRAFLKLLR